MNEPLGREIALLLDEERARPGPGAAARDRVLARVHASVATHPPSGRSPRMPSPTASGAILRPVLAFALLVGAAAWVATRSQSAPSPSVPAPETQPAASEAISAPTPSAASSEPRGIPNTTTPAVTPQRKIETPANTLPDERTILDHARAHLLSGEPAAALTDIEKHARLFRHGVLAEERDALRVEALVAVPRPEQARAAAARFHAVYPGSMLAPAVDDALRTIP